MGIRSPKCPVYENSVKTAAFWRTDCPNGYPYDPSRYSTCPYCGNGTFAPTLDPFTAAENSAGSHISGFQPTIDPFSDASGNVCCFDPAMPPNVRLSGRMSQTMYVDPHTPQGAPAADVTVSVFCIRRLPFQAFRQCALPFWQQMP